MFLTDLPMPQRRALSALFRVLSTQAIKCDSAAQCLIVSDMLYLLTDVPHNEQLPIKFVDAAFLNNSSIRHPILKTNNVFDQFQDMLSEMPESTAYEYCNSVVQRIAYINPLTYDHFTLSYTACPHLFNVNLSVVDVRCIRSDLHAYSNEQRLQCYVLRGPNIVVLELAGQSIELQLPAPLSEIIKQGDTFEALLKELVTKAKKIRADYYYSDAELFTYLFSMLMQQYLREPDE